MVERVYGMPAASAAWEPAYSPSDCIIRVKPVGAIPTGRRDGLPRMSVLRSMLETSRRIPGRNSMSRNAWRARRRVISASAAPSV